MLHSYRDEGIVLRTYKLGEADRIIVLLTRNMGQVRAVAKGIRRTTSKFGSRLGAFNRVDFQAHHGRNLDTITQVVLRSGYADPISSDYEAFTAAKVIVEVAGALTEDQPEPGHFDLLHGALAALAGGRHAAALITTSYQLRALSLSGWTPSIACAICAKSDDVTYFCADQGGFVCRGCVASQAIPVSEETRQLTAALLDGDWGQAEPASQSSRESAAKIAASWSQWQLERRLRSLPFLSQEEHRWN